MSNLKILVTLSEVVNQIDRELLKISDYTNATDLNELKQLILARTIEDIRLVELIPGRQGHLETLVDMIRSNYRRVVGDDLLTIDEDVSTNNSLSSIGSHDLSFQSELKLHRYIVTIVPRETACGI